MFQNHQKHLFARPLSVLLLKLIGVIAMTLLLSLVFVNALFAQDEDVLLPIGRDSYKIVVREDGLYALTYEALQTAGMDVASIDPTTFEMMHKGIPIAYEWVGDGDNLFEAGESVRFFGWAFDGSNHDQLYVDENYYWLWANGTPTTVQSRLNAPGGMAIDSWRSTLLFEEDVNFNITNTNDWDEFEFEGDPWFWARIASNPISVTIGANWGTPNPDLNITPEMGQSFREYSVEVIDPVPDGTDAMMTTEVFSFCEPRQIVTHTFGASLNGVQQIDQWTDRYGRSFDQMIPASTLLNGDNILRYDALTPSEDIEEGSQYSPFHCGTLGFSSDLLHPNRSILEYDRYLTAVNDQLLFTYRPSGTYDFMVSGFTVGNAADALVWDVSDRTRPSIVMLSDEHITNDEGTFTWTIGGEDLRDSRYLATTVLKTPDSLTQYVAPSLTRSDVQWIGISHADFIGEATRIGDYRRGRTVAALLSGGGEISASSNFLLNTLVVDVADVINQYGYGYNIPQAIKAYLEEAYFDWSNGRLRYVALFGDATINPRQLDCGEQCNSRGEWDPSFETFVVTDLQFYDRFAGLMPTDHSYANLRDDGTYPGAAPEIAVGRFAVNTAEEARNIVNKVILYECNQQADAAYSDYLDNLIFFADNADGGGDFCRTTRDVADNPDYVDEFTTFAEGTSASGGEPYCMDDYMADGTSENVANLQVRDDVLAEINTTGAAIVNYRGHGGRFSLSGIINANRDVDNTVIPLAGIQSNGNLFLNNDRPMVWLSTASWDGDFAYPSARESALSERLMRLEGAGAAGYWSSTGFGFDREHTALMQGFYEGLYTLSWYDYNFRHSPTIGDAIVYSKRRYLGNELGNVSEIWAFNYQGDPAMIMPHTVLSSYLPDCEYYVAPTAATISLTSGASTTSTLPIVVASTLIATTLVAINRRVTVIYPRKTS